MEEAWDGGTITPDQTPALTPSDAAAYSTFVLKSALQLVDQAYISVNASLAVIVESAERSQWKVGAYDELFRLHQTGKLEDLLGPYEPASIPKVDSTMTLSSFNFNESSVDDNSTSSDEEEEWENEVDIEDNRPSSPEELEG